jgi:hypothetical protein
MNDQKSYQEKAGNSHGYFFTDGGGKKSFPGHIEIVVGNISCKNKTRKANIQTLLKVFVGVRRIG